ncbi:MAG: M56 family metallopeptidase, partial [Bacteroidota bacterium]
MEISIFRALSILSEVLGWTLIHSLWQIGLIAVVLKISIHFVSQRNASVRYNLSLLSLLAIAIWMTVTFVGQLQNAKSSAFTNLEVETQPSESIDWTVFSNMNSADHLIANITSKLDAYLPILSSVWLLGISFLIVRLFSNYRQLHRLDQQSVQLPDMEWIERMESFCKQLGITRKIKLLLSERISEPITFRHFRPVVLLPVSMMTGLTTTQIETLLLHELAHIRRHDYIFNLLQSVLEILFFFHPAVWWISRIVREEREHCCDDLVLRHQQYPMLYAEALLQIQANHYSLKTNLAMSAKGNHKPLTTRIQRLFGTYSTPNTIGRGTIVVVLALGILSVFAFSFPNEKPNLKEETEARISSDTLPEKAGVVIYTNNEDKREIRLVVDKKVAETQEVEVLLAENGIEVDPDDIERVNIYGLTDTDGQKLHITKRVEDIEDLFDDQVVKLV